MKASNLIEALKKVIEVCGDIDVATPNDTCDGAHNVTNVMTVIKRDNPANSRVVILNHVNEKPMLAKKHINVNVPVERGSLILPEQDRVVKIERKN